MDDKTTFGNGATKRTPPIFDLPPVVWALLALLFAIHATLELGGDSWRNLASYDFAFIPARFGPTYFPQATGAAWWSMLTYGFLHADWQHLIFNSLWLVVFSKPVQARFGTWRYLMLLAASIIAGAVASLIFHWGEVLVLVGISAGVSGLLAAAIPLMYAGRDERTYELRPLRPMEILTNRNALTFTLMWAGLTFITATSQYLTGTALIEQRVIAWESHVGGFIVGLVAFYLLDATLPQPKVHTYH